MRGDSPHSGHQLNCPEAARTFFEAFYHDLEPRRETLWIAHLDDRYRCIHLSQHEGDETRVFFPLKEIVRDAVECDSKGLLLAHNHPSGDSRPSHYDLTATRQLALVSAALDCPVLDHFVFAGDDCTSFRSLGLL